MSSEDFELTAHGLVPGARAVLFANGAGSATWGPSLAGPAGWTAGDERGLQVWYRDPHAPCGSGSNLSSALQASFLP